MIGVFTALAGISQKLQNDALVHLEFDPGVQPDMGGDHDQHDNGYDDFVCQFAPLVTLAAIVDV
jgi:hypothetical protein